jgi:hypothetical protein
VYVPSCFDDKKSGVFLCADKSSGLVEANGWE